MRLDSDVSHRDERNFPLKIQIPLYRKTSKSSCARIKTISQLIFESVPIKDFHIFSRGILWHTKRSAHSIGQMGIGGITLCTLCITFFYFVLYPIQQEILSLEHKIRLLGVNENAKFLLDKKYPNSSEQLIVFSRFFPKRDTVADWIAKLYDSAAQQKLILDTGEYQFAPARNGQLSRYDITLPVKGSYLQIRKFVAQALEDVPSLALGGITFNRQKIDDAFVDAQIRFTLYLGDE